MSGGVRGGGGKVAPYSIPARPGVSSLAVFFYLPARLETRVAGRIVVT